MNRTSFIRLLKIISSVAVILIVVSYALWRSLNYARGPEITIINPTDWTNTASSTLNIHGRVERANNIYLNGNPIFIDEAGVFSEQILIFSGMNLITITAKDQFERKTEKILHITRFD